MRALPPLLLRIPAAFVLLVPLVAAAPPPAGIAPSLNVQLATTQVAVDNLSDYPDARVAFLVQMADRGMATTDPADRNVAGEMESGDRVVVTHYGIYWLDIVRRGGLLSGMWALRPSAAGADFQYVANGSQWSPNQFLPGAQASNARIYDTGQGLNVIGTGGSDGSCARGKGTFIIRNSFNCGIANSPTRVSFTTSVAGHDHLYTFAGTLYQEGTRHDMQMVDSYGNAARLDFTLTYHFRDATDPPSTPEPAAVRRPSGFASRRRSVPRAASTSAPSSSPGTPTTASSPTPTATSTIRTPGATSSAARTPTFPPG